MKILGHKNIWALVALLLAGTVISSARTTPSEVLVQPETTLEFEDDFSYMEDVEEYVDDYFESMEFEESQPSVIKVYDENGELVLIEDTSDNELSEEAIRLIRQSEFLTEYDDTTYYRLNS